MITAIDLFCGAGGLSAGLSKAGFVVLGAVDSWDRAVNTYSRNFDHPVFEADIAQLTASDLWSKLGCQPSEVDLVAGGPPCQGFSMQRIGDDHDDRNELVLEFARLVGELKPKMFLMENVPGLLGKRGAPIAAKFKQQMEAHGYLVEVTRVNAADYGVPQARKRVFFYGVLKSILKPFEFPAPLRTTTTHLTVWDAIGDLPSPPIDNTPQPGDPLHRKTKMSIRNLERLKLIPPGGGFEDLPVELRVDCHKAGADRIGHRSVYGRLSADSPAGTITARFDSFTRGRFAHPYEHRNITLREGARLQTFPDEFAFEGSQEEIAALIGNAIPPRLAEVIGRAIIQHISQAQAPRRSSTAPRQLVFARSSRLNPKVEGA